MALAQVVVRSMVSKEEGEDAWRLRKSFIHPPLSPPSFLPLTYSTRQGTLTTVYRTSIQPTIYIIIIITLIMKTDYHSIG